MKDERGEDENPKTHWENSKDFYIELPNAFWQWLFAFFRDKTDKRGKDK